MILLFIKKLGLSRGRVRHWLNILWARWYPSLPIDISYKNLRFRLYPQDNITDAKMLLGSKLRDNEELAAIQSTISSNNNGVFLDIGANTGYYAIVVASMGTGRVVAFEPNPPVFNRLLNNIQFNELSERIKALPIALSDSSGQVDFHVTEGEMGGSSIINVGATTKVIKVATCPLAKIIEQENITSINAMKIDVEGFEDKVLLPFFHVSPRTLWPRLIVIEHTSQSLWHENVLEWMLENGYIEIKRNRSNAILQLP